MSYKTAYERWSGIGPYYAMFPIDFANRVVLTYTRPGERILDPFAGRASSIFAGAAHGRPSVGIEINPVGWIYGKTKLAPAPADRVKTRVRQLVQIAVDLPSDVGDDLPEFFEHCFSKDTLRFLIAARDHLDWKREKVDRTLMTLILIDLHGNRHRSFSNQMRQSRAMSPDYSVQWWQKHKLQPPEVDVEQFLDKKIAWRYAKGPPATVKSTVWLGDSRKLMKRLENGITLKDQQRFTLLFTSPPYMGISDYHRDQWLRLWMLGGKPAAMRSRNKYRRDFSSESVYKELLEDVFLQASEVMRTSGYVYVRTDAREQTFEITREVLASAFPHWNETIIDRPYQSQTQTALYGDKNKKPGEKDIILRGPRAE
jgi:hypothetical protein